MAFSDVALGMVLFAARTHPAVSWWTFDHLTALSEIVIAVATLVGVIGSFFFSIKALREVQRDRALRQAPHLRFEQGGWQLPVEFVRGGSAIPGIDRSDAEQLYGHLPASAESVRLIFDPGGTHHYGRITNFGEGTAFDVRVTWIAHEVSMGEDTFEISEARLQEQPWMESLNNLPVYPGHLRPGDTGELTRLPAFIDKDVDKKITVARGDLRIECCDAGDQRRVFHQRFRVGTEYRNSPPAVLVTFGEARPSTHGGQ